jgi:hypothetical protein
MCDTVRIGDRVAEVVGELAELVGAANVVPHPRYGSFSAFSDCLCCVDLPATARKCGYRYEDNMGDWVFTKEAT